MAELLKPDICVIGGGSGGLTVAAAAAAFGVPVVLIEGGKMGGDCLNYGCVPSKALIAAGKTADAMRHADKFGIKAVEPEVNFGKVHDHVHGVIAAIAPNDSVERFTALGDWETYLATGRQPRHVERRPRARRRWRLVRSCRTVRRRGRIRKRCRAFRRRLKSDPMAANEHAAASAAIRSVAVMSVRVR